MQQTMSSVVEKVAEIARRAACREGIDVWDVEVLGGGKSRTVRIYIDKPAGVTHADCELISNQVGTVLDVEDVVPGSSYHLEVSSPGVERRLRTPDHFRLSSGRKARILFREPLDNQKRWEGVLGMDQDTVTLTAGEKTLRFRPDQVEKANLKFDW